MIATMLALLKSPKNIGILIIALSLVGNYFLIRNGAKKDVALKQYKEAEKSWVDQFNALVAVNAANEKLLLRRDVQRKAIASAAVQEKKVLSDEICKANKDFCNIPVPPGVAQWLSNRPRDSPKSN